MKRALASFAALATLTLAAASSCGSNCPAGQTAVYNTTTHATVCQ